jgi:hypothetical protein
MDSFLRKNAKKKKKGQGFWFNYADNFNRKKPSGHHVNRKEKYFSAENGSVFGQDDYGYYNKNIGINKHYFKFSGE